MIKQNHFIAFIHVLIHVKMFRYYTICNNYYYMYINM